MQQWHTGCCKNLHTKQVDGHSDGKKDDHCQSGDHLHDTVWYVKEKHQWNKTVKRQRKEEYLRPVFFCETGASLSAAGAQMQRRRRRKKWKAVVCRGGNDHQTTGAALASSLVFSSPLAGHQRESSLPESSAFSAVARLLRQGAAFEQRRRSDGSSVKGNVA